MAEEVDRYSPITKRSLRRRALLSGVVLIPAAVFGIGSFSGHLTGAPSSGFRAGAHGAAVRAAVIACRAAANSTSTAPSVGECVSKIASVNGVANRTTPSASAAPSATP